MRNYTFGNYIRELREKKGLSQAELGVQLGITNKAISKWENGSAYPSAEMMLPLAKALDTSIELLYSAISNDKSEKTKLRCLLDVIAGHSRIVLSVLAILTGVIWLSFLILGNRPDKATVLILCPIVTLMAYGAVRMTFWMFSKNPMASSKFVDGVSILYLVVATMALIFVTISLFITDFPNGLGGASGGALGLFAGVLHCHKKRI